MLSSKKTVNYYLFGIKAVIFLIPILPLYISYSLVFPYMAGKNFAFRILVELAAVLWAGLLVRNREYRPRNSAIFLSVLAFTFITGLADLLGVNPYKSFWSNYERMEGYITILHLALYFMIAGSVLRNKKDWKVFFIISVTVSVMVSLFAILVPETVTPSRMGVYAMEYGTRARSTIGNPPFLASYLLLSVFFAFILISNTQRLCLKLVYFLLILIDCAAIYFSASRGAALTVIGGMIMLGLFYVAGKRNMPLKRLLRIAVPAVAGILILLVVVLVVFRTADFVKQDRTLSRFATALSDESIKSRFRAWDMAWNGIKERPALGWGQENFIGVYSVNPIPLVEAQIWLDRAHNIVVDWLVNAGILGLFSYLSIFGAAFYVLRRALQKKAVSKNEAFAIATALAAYFFQNLFIFDTINTYLLFFALLAYIDNIDNTRQAPDLKDVINREKSRIKPAGITLLALLIFAPAFYYLNYKPIKVSQWALRISSSFERKYSFPDVLDDFNNILSMQTFGDADARERMRYASEKIISLKLFNREGALKFIQKTVEEMEKGIAINRYDLKYLTDVINFYKSVAIYEPSFVARTEALIRRGIRLNPEYQWLYMALADIHILKKDYENAFINVNKVTGWDPQNDKKQLKLAFAAIYASKGDIVRNSLENVKKIRMAKNKDIASGRETVLSAAELYQLALIYTDIRNFHKALQYYREIITVLSYEDNLYAVRDFFFRKPGAKAKIYLETAKVYLAAGDKKNAVIEAKKAIELDPENFGGEAKKIIDSLNN